MFTPLTHHAGLYIVPILMDINNISISSAAFSAIPSGVMIVQKPDEKIIYVNDRALNLFGLDPVKEGLDLSGLGNKLQRSSDVPLRRALSKGETVKNEELILRSADGRYVAVNSSAAPILDDKKEIIGAIAVFDDITDRKETQDWIETFNAIPDLITILDDQNRILRANKAMADKLGIAIEDAVGRYCYQCVHGTTCMPKSCPHLMMNKDAKPHTTEVHEDRLGGDFLISVTPIFDRSGKIKRSLHIAHDITERKRKENALKKLNRTLKALSDSNQALIRSTNEQEYLDKICEIIVEDCGYSMVWIGFAEDDADKSIRPVAEAGFNDDYLKTINVTWADTNFGQGPTGRSVRERVPCICGNMFIDPNFAPWREEALRRGYASSLALPMMDGSKVLGALTMYAREPNSFSDEEIRLLSELADDVAHGITLFRLRAARDEAELKLRKQADILQEQAEMLEQGYIFVRDQNDVIIFWNQGAEKLYGYTKEEAVGRVSHDLLKTEFYEPREDIEAELIETGKWEGELTHTTRYGMEIDVASHWTAHFDQYANLVGIIEFNNDITQLKMTEKMLSETSDYLDKLFNFANAPIVCWDTESKITKFNHAFERLTGYWAEEIIGQNINLLFPEENRELPIKDAVYTMEIPILNKNGEQRVVLWNSADIYGEDGKTLLATIAQAQDITEKAKELADARVKLEKSKRLSDIGVLAATVAHELRNPLATINIISAVIRRKTNDDNVKHYLNNIEKSVRESDQIINNLLYYSRIKPPHFENVRLGCIIEECLDTVKKQSQKKVCLNKSLDKLNNIVLKVDPLQMKEVFNNILNNAFDATSDGNGLIKVLASDLAETIEISIEDNGVGIKKEDIEKAFDPFFTTKAKGTGLGLSVCQQIVSLHGGKIGIESELNEGTKVRVILPKKVETVQ